MRGRVDERLKLLFLLALAGLVGGTRPSSVGQFPGERPFSSDLPVVAECIEPQNREILARTGCQSIVCVQDLAPGLIAHEVRAPGVLRVIEEISELGDDPNDVFLVPIALGPAGHKTVKDLHRECVAHSMTLLGLQHEGKILLNPGAGHAIGPGDIAVVLGQASPETLSV